ncbi:hypothetical protein [Pantanalinema sp. GBBB05]
MKQLLLLQACCTEILNPVDVSEERLLQGISKGSGIVAAIAKA